jgi:hypothetical protein
MPRPARRKIASERVSVEHLAASETLDAEVIDIQPMAGYAPRVEIVDGRVRISIYPLEAFGL